MSNEEFNIFNKLYKTGESLGCKIVFKPRRYGCRILFTTPSNKKMLFWMEFSNNRLHVKANLIYIDKYIEKIPIISDNIKNSIISTETCKNCSPHCGSPHISFHIDNIEYNPCYFKGHYFTKMDESDWNILSDLIVLENNIRIIP